MKRANKGEKNVSLADTEKSVVVMPMVLYQQMTATHTSKDEEVTWSRLEEAQKLVRSHTRSLARIFKLGSSKGERNEARCFENASSWACDPPILRCVAKTHKAVGQGGILKLRTIVGASKGLTTSLGENNLRHPRANSKQNGESSVKNR